MLTIPTPSPHRSRPGRVQLAAAASGSRRSGSSSRPTRTRSPPSRILRIFGCVFSSCSRSCAESSSVAVVEPDDHADRDHVVAHRVDERAAELAVLRCGAQRPAHRVDHAVERLRDLPDLLHAELPHLRLVAAQVEVVERDAGEMALRSLGEHGHLRDEVGAGLEVAQLARPRGSRPLSPVRTPTTRPCDDEQLLAPRSRAGSSRRPPPPARRASGRAARARRRRCRGCASAAAAGSRSAARRVST